MNIAELQPKQGKVDVVVQITDKGDIREFNKFGKTGRVCSATIKDDTGSMKLTLWNEQIDEVNVGDKIHVKNGYVSEFKDEKQLSTGKFGTLEVLEKSGVTKDEETEANVLANETTDSGEKIMTDEEMVEEELIQ